MSCSVAGFLGDLGDENRGTILVRNLLLTLLWYPVPNTEWPLYIFGKKKYIHWSFLFVQGVCLYIIQYICYTQAPLGCLDTFQSKNYSMYKNVLEQLMYMQTGLDRKCHKFGPLIYGMKDRISQNSSFCWQNDETVRVF